MIFTKHKFLLEGKHITMALKSRINYMKLYRQISERSTLTAADMKATQNSQFVSFSWKQLLAFSYVWL